MESPLFPIPLLQSQDQSNFHEKITKKMAKLDSVPFTDFPEDVQLTVLSFLAPADISSFACTSKRSVSLCRGDGRLWSALCERKWGSKTDLRRWGKGNISHKRLYATLSGWDNLIGFWRRSGGDDAGDSCPPLIFFEWGPHFVSGSRVSPSRNGTYEIRKVPFLWMSLSPEGHVVSFIDPGGRVEMSEVSELLVSRFSEGELVPVSVSFIGKRHFVVEEDSSINCKKSSLDFPRSSSPANLYGSEEDSAELEVFGSPDSFSKRLMPEIYQYFANRTSPAGDRSRRQRRREKERHGRRRWEAQHFVKIVNCSPTPERPFQGIWKGIYDDANLGLYLIAYDDLGCITCRKLWCTPESFANYSQLYWISDSAVTDSPFSENEEALYENRVHLKPIPEPDCFFESLSLYQNNPVSRILYLNASFDLIAERILGSPPVSLLMEGRIWQYGDGTFGFGFLQEDFIVDLKRVSKDGVLLDSVQCSGY